MTACSAPETNSATIGLPNSTSAAPRGTSMQSDSRTARRTPRRMRSSRPAPRFCPTYVLRESPMMLPGCSASERIFHPRRVCRDRRGAEAVDNALQNHTADRRDRIHDADRHAEAQQLAEHRAVRPCVALLKPHQPHAAEHEKGTSGRKAPARAQWPTPRPQRPSETP